MYMYIYMYLFSPKNIQPMNLYLFIKVICSTKSFVKQF